MTAAGFEPLLKFAYTSKLHFGKDNVLEIRNSASVLGFRDLDEACFDFLLPKFFSSTRSSAPFPRITCCKKKCKRRLSKEDCGIDSDDMLLDDKEVKPVVDSSSQQEVALLCKKSVNNEMGSQNSTGTPAPVAEPTNINFMQCPKYRKFQIACGKESCEKSLPNSSKVISDDCDQSCTPCSSNAKRTNETQAEVSGYSTSNSTRQSKDWADDPSKSEIHDRRTGEGLKEAPVVMKDKREGKWEEKERETDMRTKEEREHAVGFRPLDRCTVMTESVGARIEPSILPHCPLKALSEATAFPKSIVINKEGETIRDSGALEKKAGGQEEAEGNAADEVWQERGNRGQTCGMERVTRPANNSMCSVERAENMTKPLLSQANFQDLDLGPASDTGNERLQSTCPKQASLSSRSNICPFFQDLEQGRCFWKGAGLSECEGASQSGLSSLNSGEDGDSETETDGDSEFCVRERARQVSGLLCEVHQC